MMRTKDLRVPLLFAVGDEGENSLPSKSSQVATWRSCEPSSSKAGPSRRVALAYPDNTIWITAVPEASSSVTSHTSPAAGTLPQIIIPPNLTSASASGSRTPNGSRLSRPPVPRASSFAGRHRASSSASSILSSSSRRRSSALSPPPPGQAVAAVCAESASADPHARHDQRTSISDKAELRGHLREQRGRASSTQDDSRLGLGISGLGRRGLPGVHSKEEIADTSGAASPRSTRSTESNRTISTRLMGWIGGEDGQAEKDRKELMERVQEVEVEREMIKEVEEDKREMEDEEVINKARRTPVGTPRQDGGEISTGFRSRRIMLPRSWKGKITRLQVDEESQVLLILRDIGTLDMISLATLELMDSIDLEIPEPRPASEPASRGVIRLSAFWLWSRLQITRYEGPLLVVSGLPWPCALPSPNGEVTRVVLLRRMAGGRFSIVSRLELPGQGDVAVRCSGAETYLLHSTSSSLTRYPITSPSKPASAPIASQARSGTQPRSVSAATPSSSSPPARSATPGPGGLNAPNQIRKIRSSIHLRDSDEQPLLHAEPKDRETSLTKFLAHRKVEKEPKATAAQVPVDWGVGEGKEVDRRGAGPWPRILVLDSGRVAGISSTGSLDFFELKDDSTMVLEHLDLPPGQTVKEVYSLSEEELIMVETNTGALLYVKRPNSQLGSRQWDLVERHDSVSLGCPVGDTGFLVAKEEGLVLTRWTESERRFRIESVLALHPASLRGDSACIVPYDIDACFVADSAGRVNKHQFRDILIGRSLGDTDDQMSSDRLESRVTCMNLVRSDPSYLVAGDEDGVIRIWDAETSELQGSWTLFAYPVQSVALLDTPQAGTLAGTLLCTSQAGTVGLISLVEMEQMFLIPASRVPLRRVFVGGKDILLAYANGKARVWNYETQEFRRSTGLDAAEDMLGSGDWAEIRFDPSGEERKPLMPVTCGMPTPSEASHMLMLDIGEVCSFVQSSRSSMTSSPLSTLRNVLSALIPFGVDEEVDRIAALEMGIERPKHPVLKGMIGSHDSCLLPVNSAAGIWQISPTMTGTLQMALVALLRPFLDSPDHERGAAQLIAYFTASLPDCTILPDLDFFAAYYLDPIANIHQAARLLFGCRMDAMTEQEIEVTVDAHLPELPAFVPAADQHLQGADLALTMLGGMALHKYQSISPSALKAIAESIVIYLESTQSSHLSLAIELASKGFETWQTFVDPAEMLRHLFYLSTHTPASQGSQASQISAQARLAVLHVASSNPALFMSTLSMDILDAKSIEGWKSIMKLCVYMARKRPQVLENSLPKVVEAVVKSLDPNVGKMREDVQQTATVILNELVLAFSTVDFHSSTQKLAVGTHEGALIMYDLKTASRLYILEPHKHPVSAVNFSPDGRRLITVSLEEGNLTVWKIGSSLSGFFNVGGPPRQGGDKGQPFKRIEFARADDVPLDSMSALSDVQITWPGARQAKVVIKETAMTFET